MANDTWAERIWRLITPEIVYLAICYIVDIVGAVFWGVTSMEQFVSDNSIFDSEGMMQAMTDMLTQYGLLMQSLAALIAIFFLGKMYLKDYPKRRFVFDKKSVRTRSWIWIIPAGLFGSLAGNMFMNMTDLASLSENFQESEQILFSGPIWVQVIGIGVIIPICEELVYRGLVYMRMRQYLNVNLAVGASAAGFAIMHGNIVQGIYAFVLGVLFAYVYEKYGSLIAPMLVHISANLMSVCLSIMQPEFSGKMVMLEIGMAGLVVCGAAIWIIDRQVSASRIYLDQNSEE